MKEKGEDRMILQLKTNQKNEMIDLTSRIEEIVSKESISTASCLVYCPHTTAGITINEGMDPDVKTDILLGLDKAFPDRKEFKHQEGNSSAHLKASVMGSSAWIPITGGRLQLGTWQKIYFCEFDGPRTRKVFVHIQT